ncbi:MAG: hypothetical protein K8T90_11335 [Planctomycetes bacterium]|nr:hypothetical protein [Planctomycetota bacterium]
MGTVLPIVAVVVVGALLVFLFGGRPWKALFSDRHLIEMCQALDRIRTAAAERVEPPAKEFRPTAAEAEAARTDPRSASTSAGLRIHYSVTELTESPDFLSHHVSLSHPAGLIAESGSRFLAAFVLARYGVPADAATVRKSQNLVVHIEYEVAREHSAAFAASVLPVPKREQLRAFRVNVGQVGDRLNYGAFNVALPPGAPSS